MQWRVPRLWENGTAVILGGGPSILKQFNVPEDVIKGVYSGTLQPSAYSPYLEPIHKMHVIAVNVAYKIGPWIDIMFFGDTSTWLEERKDLPAFKGLRVTCADDLPHIPWVKHLKKTQKRRCGITTDPSMVTWNSNSGSAAINLAVHLGVKRIILLGFDMSLDKDENQHWHKLHEDTAPSVMNRSMKVHLSTFPEIKKDLDLLGIEVINANPESRIECFTRMNFKDIKL